MSDSAHKGRTVLVPRGGLASRCDVITPYSVPERVLRRISQSFAEGIAAQQDATYPFRKLLAGAALDQASWFTHTAIDSIRVPLGPTGAKKIQFLELGKKVAHSAIVVGRPGSGKSNLLHIVITGLALAYPPEELELYLVDFKKGVGFKPYASASLPHARFIAIESRPAVGLKVLEFLDQELNRRAELFRALNIEEYSDYRRSSGEGLPRIVLIVDEFQEFFTAGPEESARATLLLDRIVRQGRAFGVHAILASQTLLGEYALPASTLAQISVRMVLTCSDEDATKALDADTQAAHLLERPGQMVYNAHGGRSQYSLPLQVAVFSEADKEEYLPLIAEHAPKTSRSLLVVEGLDSDDEISL